MDCPYLKLVDYSEMKINNYFLEDMTQDPSSQ
jgi:hypothetical protein